MGLGGLENSPLSVELCCSSMHCASKQKLGGGSSNIASMHGG